MPHALIGRLATAAALATVMLIASASSANAQGSQDDQPDTQAQSGGWVMVNTETGASISSEELLDLIPEPPSQGGGAQPLLINDPLAWTSCFGPLFNADYPLGSYDNVPKATGTIYLQCGNNEYKSYGWWHIQNQHQGQWEDRIKQVVDAGGVEVPWDDLMAAAVWQTLQPNAKVTREYGGKRCYSVPVTIYRTSDFAVIFSYNPSTVLSMTNNRVITAIPSSNQACTTNAPWDS